jgi:hypothetical protein
MKGSVTSARYKPNPRQKKHAGDELRRDLGTHIEMRSARAFLS